MPDLTNAPVPSPSQPWTAIITTIAGAVAAVVAKKRFTKNKLHHGSPPRGDTITRTEFHQSLDTVRDRIDANHRELLTTVTNQGAAVEKRLDALESTVARLDERTKNS